MTAPTSQSQMPASILGALRKATQIAIKFNPRTIVLTPYAKVKKTGGGEDWVAQTPRAPQTFTIEPVASTLTGITGTAGGAAKSQSGASAHVWDYTLTGAYDAEIEINDRWQDGETNYRVLALQPFNGYEKVAVVQAFGADPNYGS